MKNKKILGMPIALFVIGVLVVGGASATLLTYFGVFDTTIDVESPIVVSDGTTEVSGMAGATVEGEEATITNNADFDVDVQITSTEEVGVTTSYVGNLELAEKNVDFGLDVWTLKEGGATASVKYTLIGDSFSAEITSGSKEEYVLIYYKDNSERYANPATAILVEDVEYNLPHEEDGNVDEYDYCLTGEYDTCHGAKIWYVPADAINTDKTLNWARASEFLYETELIQYNDAGVITMYPHTDLIFKPVFDLNILLKGIVVITTTVDIAP